MKEEPRGRSDGVAVYHAGEVVRVSGIYAATDGRRATLNRGDRFPPLDHLERHFVCLLVRVDRHGGVAGVALPGHWVLVMGRRRQEKP